MKIYGGKRNMQTYIIFMKNLKTGEDFSVPHNGPVEGHKQVMAEVAKTYPAAKFRMLTAYSLNEMQDALENIRRWPGVASKPQTALRSATSGRVVTTAIPCVQRPAAPAPKVKKPSPESIFAVNSILNRPVPAKTKTVIPQKSVAKPTQSSVEAKPMAKSEQVVAKQVTEQPAKSVINLIKAMKEHPNGL